MVDEAKNAGCFDNIIVSTEDKEADSRKAGADVLSCVQLNWQTIILQHGK